MPHNVSPSEMYNGIANPCYSCAKFLTELLFVVIYLVIMIETIKIIIEIHF